ncbi:molecular chaperone TorD [Vibrio sp. SS-MA-C1-2]|uniref:molecular chaperone TorD n=1 Tax=Vibrio sp. SS-MA-C1-2 TaxID=2908646 RepID=UPI001F1DF3A5|nr:molecular chaperone TorD [Vibrio sp. SS-MA-C1-2]UJF18165.1 molecular chaperone TorD [Vibrio sp. SS-MA-C1-2]
MNDELNLVRSQVYQLLSSFFAKEISTQQRLDLTTTEMMAFWSQLSLDPQFSHDIKIITKTLEQANSERDLLELAADYCGLFLVGTKHSASPYAGLYQTTITAEQEPTLFGPQHQQMVTFLNQSELSVQSEFREPADHVAVILAYLSHLCTKDPLDEQKLFITTTLTPWLNSFVNKVVEVDKGQDGVFYSAVARLTLSWLESDLEWLDLELNS